MGTSSIRSAQPVYDSTLLWRSLSAVVIAAVVATLLGLSLAPPAGADDLDDDDGGEYAPRQIVVKMKPAFSVGYINNKYRTRTLQTLPGGEKIHLLLTPQSSNPASLARAIEVRESARVLYAEPNFTTGLPEASRRHGANPGGKPTTGQSGAAQYEDQYAVDNLNLEAAHGVSSGASSVVAVIDTGVQVGHPLLVDKLTEARYDFVDNDRTPHDLGDGRDNDLDGEVDETVGHGTHVSGIVALAAPEAKIMPVRALDTEGRGTEFGIAKAIQFAVRNGADVVNLSLGSSHESDLLEDLIEEDDDDGRSVVFVAASGNDSDSVEQYPAAEGDAIAVASVDQAKQKSDFSNFSSIGNQWVDIAAPGTDIHSPFPKSQYAMWSGTSMATPFVAGQAALIFAQRPTADVGCVTDIIQTTADPLTSDLTYGTQLGSGHADIGESTSTAATAPSPLCSTGGSDE